MKDTRLLWFWRSAWFLSLLLGLGIFALYTWLPADGATGDLTSFTSRGFRVQWLLEERVNGLQVGDIIVRAGGHTVDTWLNGAPRGPEWRTGGIATYEILRDGQPVTLEIRLSPIPFRAILARRASQLFVALAFFSTGSFVFWKRPHELASRLLMLFCVTTALHFWGDAYSLQYSTLPWRWPFWLHLAWEHIMLGPIFASLCHFALVFPVPHPLVKRFPRLVPLVLYASSPLIILGAMALSPKWNAALQIGNRASLGAAMIQGGLAIGAAIHSARTARDPVARTQIRWILWIISGGIVVLTPGYVLPVILNGRPLLPHPVIMLLIAFVPVAFATAILRYHLVDIKIIINRSLVYSTLTALLGGLYLLLVRLLTLAIQAGLHRQDDTLVVFIATLSIALAFAPLRRRVQAVIDRAFYRTKLDYRRLFPEMSARLATSIVLDQLAALLTDQVPQQLQIAWATLVVLDPNGEQLVSTRNEGCSGLPIDHPLVEYMRQGRPLLRLQPPSPPPAEAQTFLDQHGIELSIPLLVGSKLVGLYNLGPKLSGDVYNHYEVRLLRLLGQQAAVSVENARLYQQVENYSRTLEDQVQRRTRELEITYRNLAEQHIKLNIILHNVADGLVVTDLEDRIVLVNPAFGKMLIQSSDELIGHRLDEVFPDENLLQAVSKARRTPNGVTTADAILSNRIYRALACALKSENYPINGVVTVLRDITHEVEISRMKDNFVSMVSHELRTPLTSVLGFAHLIYQQFAQNFQSRIAPDDSQGQEVFQFTLKSLKIIIDAGGRLARLVNDMLDIAKMEAGRIHWEVKEVSLAEIVRRSKATVHSLAQEKGISIETDITTELSPLYGDQDRLIQVMVNLLSNAIKFTDEGKVSIRVWPLVPGDDIAPFGIRQPEAETGLPATRPLIAVSVTDTGTGIAASDLPQIFEKFHLIGDWNSDPQRSGTGLGLSICREIIEHHEGHIWAESCLEKGSRFIFTLPVRDGSKMEMGDSSHPKGEKR